MNKIILVLAFLNLISFSYSQDRVNREEIEFINKSSKITNASGWAFNTTDGKWYENKNKIDDRKIPSYAGSDLKQNFKFIQICYLEYNEKKYYLFTYAKSYGEFKYKNIRQDWETSKRNWFFVMSEENYISFKNDISDEGKEIIVLNFSGTGRITDKYNSPSRNEYNDRALINEAIKKINDKPYYSKLTFKKCKSGNRSVIRFLLPEFDKSLEPTDNTYFEIDFDVINKLIL